MSHLDRRKTQTMVQHTNTKQNWYQVSSSKTSAKAADKELHSQFTCVHLYLFLTWNLIVKLIRWPHGLVDGFLLRSFHHFAACIPQEPKIAGVSSTLVSSLHYRLCPSSSSVQERLPSQLRLSSASPLLVLELVCCTTVILCHNTATAATSSLPYIIYSVDIGLKLFLMVLSTVLFFQWSSSDGRTNIFRSSYIYLLVLAI